MTNYVVIRSSVAFTACGRTCICMVDVWCTLTDALTYIY